MWFVVVRFAVRNRSPLAAHGRHDIDRRESAIAGTFVANRHNFKGNFVWDLPDLQASGSTTKALGLVLNDWQLSGVWTAATGIAHGWIQLSERRQLDKPDRITQLRRAYSARRRSGKRLR